MPLGNFRGWEWLVILVIVLLLFGARKLPGLARSIGQSITEFRKGVRDDTPPATVDKSQTHTTDSTEAKPADPSL